ncbi:MAG: NACHT domain-containing protein, partial [Acidobacteriota bacterium]
MMSDERLRLIQTLNGLPPPQLDQVIFLLDPPMGLIPTARAASADRSFALLQWAEGTGGCGLEDVQTALELVLTNGNGISNAAIMPAASIQTQSCIATHLAGQSHTDSIVNLAHGTVIINQTVNTSEIPQQVMPNHNKEKTDSYSSMTDGDAVISQLFKECFQEFTNLTEWVQKNSVEPDFLSKAGQAYTDQLERRYGAIRILGMREPVALRSIYTHANILEKITSQQRVSLDELEQYFDRDKRGFGVIRETVAGIDVVNKLNKFIVLGKPGAGKTTFLRWIALQAADDKLNKRHIPIFINLKDWSDSNRSLMTFIIEQFEICHFPETRLFIEHILGQGKGLLLLDGLDEVSNENQYRIIKEVKDFADKYGNNQFVLS